ncbi:hypothetical protein WJX81_005317 [Elliptochloris bilobata]|uniref:Uncharacterized protein n=1 Tax=Elliptochloris bilobata TaxID=381761 RepID=A0AAW1SJM7_9CHLO
MLQAQLSVLRSKYAVGAAVTSAARCIWLGYVADSGVLSADFPRAVEALTHSGEPDPPPANVLGQAVPRQGMPLLKALGLSLHKALPLTSLLAMCFLACWHCRETVMPTDLLRWAASGELCYLNMAEVVRPVREAAGEPVLPESIVKPQGVPGLHAVMADAAHQAKALGLTLPGINAVALLRRFIMELSMPQALLPVAADLFRVHVAGMPQAARLGPARVKNYMRTLQGTSLAGHQPPDGLSDFQRTLLATAGLAGDEPAEGVAFENDARTDLGAHGHSTVASEGQDDAGARLYRLLGPPHHPVSKHVHPDYAALLTVGAAYLWIRPEYVHALVCNLEMTMADAELEAGMHSDTH